MRSSARSGLVMARVNIATRYRVAESVVLPELISSLGHGDNDSQHDSQYEHQFAATHAIAGHLLDHLRQHQRGDWLNAFLDEYKLTNAEGLALLTLSEALLRIPDSATINQLLHDKLAHADWQAHRGRADSWLINSATLGLSIAQSLLNDEQGILHRLVARMSEPVVRHVAIVATRLLADHFVLGETIEDAIQRAYNEHLHCSFDMLGEAARTQADSERYFTAYSDAIEKVGKAASSTAPHAISVKLSALYPRYEPLHAKHAVAIIAEKLSALAQRAASHNLQLTVDAEECERLDMSLQIIEQVARTPALREWNGFGLAVQAYQKRALPVLRWLNELAQEIHKPINVRLVKGAYWDTEIKRCQQAGLNDYPVFTRKAATDVSYLACAYFMLHAESIRCAFATHNAVSVAQLLNWMQRSHINHDKVEFQRLHGMGEQLYSQVCAEHNVQCRVYAPVGGHRELLAYLVRRMLENGANNSFVQQVRRDDIGLDTLVADPVKTVLDAQHSMRRSITGPILLPPQLFGEARQNSVGIDMSDTDALQRLHAALAQSRATTLTATVISNINVNATVTIPIRNPANLAHIVGYVTATHAHDINAIVDAACQGYLHWSVWTVNERAVCLERAAELLQSEMNALIALLVTEAGKTRADAMNEVREAIDFCRYYANSAREVMREIQLTGPTGETNTLRLCSRGVFACISPWNFPLAIFVGQIVAALVTGNSVIAKPAPQTPLIAAMITRMLHQAGVPRAALHLMPGDADIGEALIAHPRIAGVVFTGSTSTARRIAHTLLQDPHRPLVPLIAETGGINTMIVDSTALPEQVVSDVVISAFHSAGQRCSALRLLCLQEEIYESVVTMLQGAMAELKVGDPVDEDTDVGPVIDATAQQRINDYLVQYQSRIRCRVTLPPDLNGHYVTPTLLEVDHVQDVQQEIFGPVLHVTRWKSAEILQLVNNINASGYGLTLGVHTRLESLIELIRNNARVGNLYVNRSMIGAVVGVQPFGGEGLSGTGFKAGGPHYLLRFCTERTVSVDTTAAGGNATLLSNASI